MKPDILDRIFIYVMLFIVLGGFILMFTKKIKNAQEELDRNDLSTWETTKAKSVLVGSMVSLVFFVLLVLFVLSRIFRGF